MQRGKLVVLSLMDFMLNLAMLLLLGEIVAHIFFPELTHTHAVFFRILDIYIMVVFTAELVLYYFKYEDLKQYLRKHWLSILAFILAFGIVRFVRADRILAVVEEEETVLLSGIGRGVGTAEFPIILGKVVKLGGCACKRERLKNIIPNETEKPRYVYSVLELKEIRDAAVK